MPVRPAACALLLASLLAGCHQAGPDSATPRTTTTVALTAPIPVVQTFALPPPANTTSTTSSTTSTTMTSAPPALLTDDRDPGWEARRGNKALATISYPWRSLGYTIAFLPGRPDYSGRGFHDERRIEIYVRPDESEAMLRHVIAHELGHAVDYLFMTPDREALWRTLRGISPTVPWSPCGFCSDFDYPSGDFAETFAWWQLGSTDFRSRVAPPPSAAQLVALEPLLSY